MVRFFIRIIELFWVMVNFILFSWLFTFKFRYSIFLLCDFGLIVRFFWVFVFCKMGIVIVAIVGVDSECLVRVINFLLLSSYRFKFIY